MKLESFANITHGVTLSRVELPIIQEKYSYPLFTMQDLTREMGSYNLDIKYQFVSVNPNKLEQLVFAKLNDLVIGLTSRKAIVVTHEHKDKVIPSNFALVEVDTTKVNPFYIAWYFNEHPTVQKELAKSSQGSSVKAMSVQVLRELDMSIPCMKKQNAIGEVYRLNKLKEKLLYERKVLEDKLYKSVFIKSLEEDKKWV